MSIHLRLAVAIPSRLAIRLPRRTTSVSVRSFSQLIPPRMPIATRPNGANVVSGNGIGETSKPMKWLAAGDVTVEIGGQTNVDKLRQVSYDFSSESRKITEVSRIILIQG